MTEDDPGGVEAVRDAEDEGLPPAEGGVHEEREEDEDLLDDQADAAEDLLNGLLSILGLEGEAVAEIEDATIYVDVEGASLGLLIGRHGSTLEALQELVRAHVQHASNARATIRLDISGYRERQRAALERRALSVAATVRKTKTAMALEPMSSYERRVVHTALMDLEGVMTASEGEEPERKVVIRPT